MRHAPWGKIALTTLALAVVIAVVPPFRRAAAAVTSRIILVVASPLAPDISGFDDLPETSKVLAADGTVLAELNGGQGREPVALKDLPDHVTKAVLAAEDKTFYSHGGIEPEAVFRAILRNAQGKTQGGSTITQQLAKINYTNSERTMLRKLREVLYATQLEKKYSKDELLERYLNQVYFGENAYGISAAASTFFGVEAKDLTPAQAAMIAGKIKSPEGLDPRRNPDAVTARRDAVLRNMARNGWLDDKARDEAIATPVEVVAAKDPAAAVKAPHFVEFVKREAAGLGELGGSPEGRSQQLFNGGLTIKTTLDVKAFDASITAVQQQLGLPEDPATGIASVQPGDGAIRNLFGGLNFDRKFDVASQGFRQPGSSFKPFVYLAAVRDGIDPRSLLDASSPKELEYRGSKFTVNNYEGEGQGMSTIDNALVHSINTVFSQVALEAGPPNVVETAKAAGINDSIDQDKNRPSIALGGISKGVTPLEMAAAYATFAAKGVYATPYSITEIATRDGKVIYSHKPATREAFAANEVGVLNNALIGVVESGTGRAARIGRPVAGKTGTTQNYGDAWFVGFVPQLSTAVWVGNPEKIEPMTNVHGRKVSGGSFPTSIWAQVMRAATAGMKVERIFTATPDSLSLRMLSTTTSSTSSTSSSTTSSTSSTTTPASTSTTRPPATTTTTRPKQTSTTTSTTAPANSTTGSGSG